MLVDKGALVFGCGMFAFCVREIDDDEDFDDADDKRKIWRIRNCYIVDEHNSRRRRLRHRLHWRWRIQQNKESLRTHAKAHTHTHTHISYLRRTLLWMRNDEIVMDVLHARRIIFIRIWMLCAGVCLCACCWVAATRVLIA